MGYYNLIKARKEKGLSQKEISNLLAMEQTTYSKKERGISRITETEWVLIAKILEKDIEELKNKTCEPRADSNLLIYLHIIEIITKYNQKLEEENSLLKRQLNI